MIYTTSRVLSAKISRSLGVVFTTVLFATAGLEIAPSEAQEIDYGHVIGLVEKQSMLVEKMSKESVLLALQVGSESHLADLKDSHELFNGIQAGLRGGDASLGLPPTDDPAILSRLALVSDLWPLFDGAIRTALQKRAVGRGEIDTLAELNEPLLEALGGTAEAYAAEAGSHQLHSMLGMTIGTASRQRLLSQRMAKEFFLIAYRHEAKRNRSRLKKSIDLFDQAMKDLFQGNPQQRLIAPPTQDIRSQLEAADQIWRQIKPLMRPALAGDVPSKDEIQKVAVLNVKLLEAVEQALKLYMAL